MDISNFKKTCPEDILRTFVRHVPDIMDMATARDEMPTTMEEYRIMADKEANDE